MDVLPAPMAAPLGALLLLLAAQAAAQVPPIERLASSWVPVKVCRPFASSAPLRPCDAGRALDARTCGDYGCCALPKGGPAGAPACYAPNGGSRGSANQTAFGADPWLNDGQAVASLSQPGAILSVDWSADLLGVTCFAAPPFVGSCGSPGGGLLLRHGGSSFAALSVDGAPSATLATGMATQWMPHQIGRNATLWRSAAAGGGALRSSSELRTVFGKQTVLLRLEIDPVPADGGAATPLSLTLDLTAQIYLQDYGHTKPKPGKASSWGWDVVRPQNSEGFAASIGAGGTLSLTSHTASGAHSAAAFSTGCTSAPQLSLDTTGYVTASWTGLDPTQPFVAEIVLAVGSDAATVASTATAVAGDFTSAWQGARDDWQGWWASLFDPTVATSLPFEGHLPTLTTDDDAIKRVYYMNVVSLLGNARHVDVVGSQVVSNGGSHTSWNNRTVFATGGPVCAVAEMIIWDTTLNSVLLTLLQPTLYKSYIERWLSMDVHDHLAIDIVSNTGQGKWYAFNDMMMYRGMETMARLLDTKEFVTSILGTNPGETKPTWQWMEETATYWMNLTRTYTRNPYHSLNVSGCLRGLLVFLDGCNTPACTGVAAEQELEKKKQLGSGGRDDGACSLAGVWFGCHAWNPTAGSCKLPGNDSGNDDEAMTITVMPLPGGSSVHVDFPEGAIHKWWSTGIGNLTASNNEVVIDLFMADGKPYPTPSYLRGKATACGGLVWSNTNTSWCKNGSASWCTSHAPPAIIVDGLADYGTETHLLECVPTYTHKVAALNAANAHMMRVSALIADGLGHDPAHAAALRAMAMNISRLVRTKLYVPQNGTHDGGFFAAEHPSGQLIGVRHVIDFISVATSIAEDLPAEMRSDMMGFVSRELLTKNWMRALSLKDISLLHPSANSDRKDHGPLGAYDGWPGAQAFSISQRRDLPLEHL